MLTYLRKGIDTHSGATIIADSLLGWLAQLGEHLPYKQRVGGSIPSPPTKPQGFGSIGTPRVGYLER